MLSFEVEFEESSDVHMVCAKMGRAILKPVESGPESVIVVGGHAIPLTGTVSRRISGVLDYYRDKQRVHDCHFLGRALGTGKLWDSGMPSSKELRENGLEPVGVIRFENIYSEQRHIERSLWQLGGTMWNLYAKTESERDRRLAELEKRKAELPEIERKKYPFILRHLFKKGRGLECGDLCLMRGVDQGHSLTFLWIGPEGEDLFMSRMGGGGDLAIHTVQQSYEYYNASNLEVWRGIREDIPTNPENVETIKSPYPYCPMIW